MQLRLRYHFQWRNLKISQKYLLNLLIVLLITLVSVAIATILLVQAQQKVDGAGAEANRVVQITDIGSLFRSKDSGVADYLINPGDAAVSRYTQDQQQLTRMERQVQPYMKTLKQQTIFNRIMRNDSMTYDLFQNELVPAISMNDMKKARSIRNEQNGLQADTMRQIQNLRVSVLSQEQSAVASARAQIRWSIIFLILSLILSVAVSGCITYFIHRQMRLSFAHVLKMTDRIASGDLRGSAETVRGKDEIGLIAQSIINMKNNLLNMTLAIARLSTTSRQNSHHLIQSVRKVAENSNHVKEAMAELSAGTEDQAKNTSQISELAGRFMDSLSDEAGRASSINELSVSATEATKKGKTSIDSSVSHMALINSSVQDCMVKMTRLDERMKDISSLIHLIEGIARETNLLALNASIESARAGAGGKGFAVIAESIRNLSDQTSESVKKISGMMNEIRTNSGAVHQALIMSYEQVRNGSDQIKSTGGQFTQIDAQMKQVGEKIKNMSARLHEISEIGQNMIHSIESIAAVSEQSAATVGNVTQSMENVNETMLSFSHEAESMALESKRMDDMMNRFKLNDSPAI